MGTEQTATRATPGDNRTDLMPSRSVTPGDDRWNTKYRGEKPLQRADRNFGELLQELRVAQTGVQILFAFLLGLSFTTRFSAISEFQLYAYVATLVSSAITTALLIAPVAAHRLQFQCGHKVQLVRLVHRCLIAGLITLLVTVLGAMLLVLDVALNTPTAITITAVLAVCFLALWVGVPGLLRFGRDRG
jgi:hypothetical protein